MQVMLRPISTAPKVDEQHRIWLSMGLRGGVPHEWPDMWQGYWDTDAAMWRDTAKSHIDLGHLKHSGPKRPQPKFWAKSLPDNTVPLPDELDKNGEELIDASDEVGIDAQGGAWFHYEKEGWKYLLVTPRFDDPAIRARLEYLFEAGAISRPLDSNHVMTIEDVKLVGPNDHTFQLLNKFVSVNFGGESIFKGSEHYGVNECDNGEVLKFWFRCNAVVYRAMKTVDGSDFKRPDPLPANIQRALAS